MITLENIIFTVIPPVALYFYFFGLKYVGDNITE